MFFYPRFDLKLYKPYAKIKLMQKATIIK